MTATITTSDGIDHNGKTNLYTALALAQAEMTRAKKDSVNPHFKSSYADLSAVQDACFPALNKHGIAVTQIPIELENGKHYLKTMLIHGPTTESIECNVPILMNRQDAQGYGSALTYARRYGLMSVAGIAPADDDGNAASEPQPKQDLPVLLSDQQIATVFNLLEQTDSDLTKFLAWAKVDSVNSIPVSWYDAIINKLMQKLSLVEAEQLDAEADKKSKPATQKETLEIVASELAKIDNPDEVADVIGKYETAFDSEQWRKKLNELGRERHAELSQQF